MKERIPRGELYRFEDHPELVAGVRRAQGLLERYNATPHAERAKRDRLLRELLAEVGDGAAVRAPFHCDYGDGISLGARTFVNFNAVMLDTAPIVIGADCQLASGVQLLTAGHPLEPGLRREGWESGEPIELGENVWLGAGVLVCPGVSIGESSVVGAGGVVTGDLPSNVLAVGNPAKPVRELGDSGAGPAAG
jgi:maltose O-acetyltransferase